MTTSVIELIPNGGSEGWDRMGLGYDTSNPIIWSVYHNYYGVDFSLTDAAVAGVIDKITIAQSIITNAGGSCTVKCRMWLNGTLYETTPTARGTGWAYVDVAVSPATSAAWTWAEIDNLMAGIYVYVTYGATLSLCQFKVQVTYTPEAYVPPTLTKGSPAIGCGSMIF